MMKYYLSLLFYLQLEEYLNVTCDFTDWEMCGYRKDHRAWWNFEGKSCFKPNLINTEVCFFIVQLDIVTTIEVQCMCKYVCV